MTVDVARRAGLGELVRRSAARTPGSTAVIFGDRTWTYAALLEASEAAAGALAKLGVGPGDRVAVLGRNSDTYVITWLATQLAGAIHVPVNFMLNAREVAYIVEHSGAALALADAELFDRLPASTRTATLEDFEAAWDRAAFAEPPEIVSSAVAQIAYTSGTESAPKGAMLTHEGLLAQYVSCIVAGEYAATDVMLHALPLYHCAQLHCFIMPGLYLGAVNVILPAPAPDAVFDAVREHDATSFFAPPTVWIGLLQDARFDPGHLGTLTKGYYGASIMPVQTVRDLSDRLPDLRLWNYYGQTELGPLATYLGPDEQLTKPGSAGRPVLNVTTRVVDEDMRDVGVGEVGEVVHRSPQVTAGYYNDPERTAAAFAGGWFHSGDLATVDADGYLTIVDRKKDMINSGGENVSSREVEEVLYRHPAVAEVAVVGIPDERWIEAVCAVVVARDGSAVEADELRAFAREDLAGFKVPKSVVFVDALPKNPSGKILKRELRAQAASSSN
jgi:fatty-acyl-CoA synthase